MLFLHARCRRLQSGTLCVFGRLVLTGSRCAGKCTKPDGDLLRLTAWACQVISAPSNEVVRMSQLERIKRSSLRGTVAEDSLELASLVDVTCATCDHELFSLTVHEQHFHVKTCPRLLKSTKRSITYGSICRTQCSSILVAEADSETS